MNINNASMMRVIKDSVSKMMKGIAKPDVPRMIRTVDIICGGKWYDGNGRIHEEALCEFYEGTKSYYVNFGDVYGEDDASSWCNIVTSKESLLIEQDIRDTMMDGFDANPEVWDGRHMEINIGLAYIRYKLERDLWFLLSEMEYDTFSVEQIYSDDKMRIFVCTSQDEGCNNLRQRCAIHLSFDGIVTSSMWVG